MSRRVFAIMTLALLPAIASAAAPLSPDQLLQRIRSERAADCRGKAHAVELFTRVRHARFLRKSALSGRSMAAPVPAGYTAKPVVPAAVRERAGVCLRYLPNMPDIQSKQEVTNALHS